jgi:hypothetical protein
VAQTFPASPLLAAIGVVVVVVDVLVVDVLVVVVGVVVDVLVVDVLVVDVLVVDVLVVDVLVVVVVVGDDDTAGFIVRNAGPSTTVEGDRPEPWNGVNVSSKEYAPEGIAASSRKEYQVIDGLQLLKFFGPHEILRIFKSLPSFDVACPRFARAAVESETNAPFAVHQLLYPPLSRPT